MYLKLRAALWAAIAALTFFAPFYACKNTVKDQHYFEQLSQYVYAYTNGIIDRDEAIRVRFVNAAISPEQIGTPVAAGVLQISPSIEGEPVWEDDRTIRLQPSQPLPYGQKYEARLSIGSIYKDAPSNIRTFEFSFMVRELYFEMHIQGIQTPDFAQYKTQQITGSIQTSVPVEAEALEKALAATQEGKTLNISWNHLENNTQHLFTVNQVTRGMKRSAVTLNWDGAHIGLPGQKTETIPVPGLDEFEVLSVFVDHSENQTIVLNFSDPISDSQDLNGLVRVEGYTGHFNYKTDGNFLYVYPGERLEGAHQLIVENIKNSAGAVLKNPFKQTINFENLKPAVRLVGRGAVIPGASNGSVIFPFEAVGLRSVDIEIFKIFQSNILQYLQVNELEGEQELERVGKIIFQKSVHLAALNPGASSKVWQRYALDLKDMIRQDPGAIYQVRISFRRSYVSHLSCGEDAPAFEETALGAPDEYGNLRSLWGGYRGIYYAMEDDYWWDDGDYDYDHRDAPCFKEYYNQQRFARRNVFVSDLGLTAKRGKDGSILAVVTDLNSTAPIGNVQIEFFNYQLQSIGKATTASDGVAYVTQTRDQPYLMVARQGERRGYLRMADGSTLSLSRFDVAGVESQKGLKGYLYGERGVWRPGDSVYLNFVLEDRSGKLPAGHPINFEVADPGGTVRHRAVIGKGVNGVFPLHFATSPDAPTGNWMARVDVGGAKFSKTLKIETVKPNRLKIELDFPKKSLSVSDEDEPATLSVQWLHGATAKNLRAKVDMQVRTAVTQFPNFKDFVFEDPARSFYSEEETLFDGTLDERGNAKVPLNINVESRAPGKLIAYFKVRAFEPGGDFSSDNAAIDYYPYPSMVGIKVPKDARGNAQMEAGKTGQVEVVCVDHTGRPLANKTVEVGLYRCDWRWWWDEDRLSNVGQFNSDTHINALSNETLTTDRNGRAIWKVSPATWGRYLIRAIDPEGGHASGGFFWTGYPDRMDDLLSRNSVAMLPLAADRDKYNVGETVTIKLPSSEIGRVLVTLENGQKVVKHLWFDAKPGDNLLTFKAEPEMAPAIYAHVSLLQPHAQTKNDLPIRMYGVVPVHIENPATRLKPIIEMADVIKPGTPFQVRVKETAGLACAYTLAIVDEGLLDLTRFETPNPHEAFFAREALGVKTWDIYDYVLGAYGVELERILSIGGDAFNRKAKNSAQVNRFKPAVVHLGPFYLAKGQTAMHTINIQNYVGSVRVMAVCSAPAPNGQGAYGSAEKTCPVRKPLMILPSLPRVLGPGETVRLPIQVFAMEKQVKNATLRIKERSGNVTITGSPTQTLAFTEPGDQIAWFDLKVGPKTGPAQFTFEAQGGGETATDVIDILVRNPMPKTTTSWEGVIEPGKEWSSAIKPEEYAEITSASLEVSALPPLNFDRHLEYLLRYPHGCVEQITSAAFPQLYADIMTPLSAKQRSDITKNVNAAIQKLGNRQAYSGGFQYWPGAEPDPWSTTYAGHFLLEAKAKGYAVPESVLEKWVRFQTDQARAWNNTFSKERWYYYDNTLTQAYRLYSLALAGKPAIADMNRLKESKELEATQAYLLANAYAVAGKPEIAQSMLKTPWKEDYQYQWCGYTYGSDLRDRALILEAYTALGDDSRAEAMMNYLAKLLSNEQNSWHWNTQSLAVSLRALSKYAQRANVNGPAYTYRLGSQAPNTGDATKPISVTRFEDNIYNAKQISVKNNGKVKLYARMVVSGQKMPGVIANETPSNLKVEVRWENPQGKPINVSQLPQGADFVAVVTVSRNSPFYFPFNELALTQIFPSGWEIANTRMGNFSVKQSQMDYQDFRDDRVLTYFDLNGDKDQTRTFRIYLNAAYKGRFFMPTTQCEAMYDGRIHAGVPGFWVEVS